jgi:hypothetical protein
VDLVGFRNQSQLYRKLQGECMVEVIIAGVLAPCNLGAQQWRLLSVADFSWLVAAFELNHGVCF